MTLDTAHLVRALREQELRTLTDAERREQEAQRSADLERRLLSTVRVQKRDQIPDSHELSPD